LVELLGAELSGLLEVIKTDGWPRPPGQEAAGAADGAATADGASAARINSTQRELTQVPGGVTHNKC